MERKVAAEDQLKRIDIRAPQKGTIHQLAVHTIGGVIGASEVLMLVVPEEDALNVEVKVSPLVGNPLAVKTRGLNAPQRRRDRRKAPEG